MLPQKEGACNPGGMEERPLGRPGRTRFAPAVGARRAPAESAASVEAQDAQGEAAAPLAAAPAAPQSTVHAAPATQSSAGSAAIEAVAARRERRGSLGVEGATSRPSGSSLPAPGTRVTMASFLWDAGVGVPMASSGGPSRSARSAEKTTMVLSSAGPSVATLHYPQVRIVDGRAVVVEDANISDAPAVRETVSVDVVNESGRHLTSHAFVKTIGANRWSAAETDKFHEAVSMCGTDFAIMALLFPRRTREQIKGKWRVEERADPARLAASLARRVPLDMAWLAAARAEREALAGRAPGTRRAEAPPTPETGSAEDSRRPGRPRQAGGDVLSSLLASPVRASPAASPESPRRRRRAPILHLDEGSPSPSPKRRSTRISTRDD